MTGKIIEKYLIESEGNTWDPISNSDIIIYDVQPVEAIRNSEKYKEAFAEATTLTEAELQVDLVFGLELSTVVFCFHPIDSVEVYSNAEFTWPELAALGIFNS
jgi:hypothetical protein